MTTHEPFVASPNTALPLTEYLNYIEHAAPLVHSESFVAESSERYAGVSDRKSEGAHYTPTELAKFVARQIVTTYIERHQGATGVSVWEPAVGDGELLLALLDELEIQGIRDVKVKAFDLNPVALDITSNRVSRSHPQVQLELQCENFLERVLTDFGAKLTQPSLMSEPSKEQCDIIIANPPYVRTQVMGASQAQDLAQQFQLTGRVDLYHAFIHAMGRALRPGGIAGVIVSNRFMTTRGGKSVRQDIVDQFNPLHIWDLGDTKLFTAAVLPAVLLLEGKDKFAERDLTKFTTIYATADLGDAQLVEEPVAGLELEGIIETGSGSRFQVTHGVLDQGKNSDDVWRISTAATTDWLGTVDENTWRRFGDIGQIRVGVKTTADKVFIRSDWDTWADDELPELLRPLTTHHVAQRFKALEPKKKRGIVYPHVSVEGKRRAADLSEFPKTAKFLEDNREALESRTYVMESGRNWFEIWVPQDPALWSRPKIVFRDISEKPTFWIDLEGTIVNGDCYWMTPTDADPGDILWLAAAVANSTFIEHYYDKRFNNKLYAGRRRFMTQYVEQFPLPNPASDIAKAIIELTKQVYDLLGSSETGEHEKELDGLIWQSFGLGVEKVLR